jgi:Ca-activated chloride channel family protein
MTDDLDNLKAMMTAATPKPNAAKRAENLALAQKNFESLQGSTAQLRLTLVTGLQGLWTGVTTMLSNMTSRGGLTTTSAFVACGFLFLTPTGQGVWQAPRLSSPTIIRKAPRQTKMWQRRYSTTPPHRRSHRRSHKRPLQL